MEHAARFFVGQIVHHKRFDYRGVVFDVDSTFQGTDEWYEQVAQSRPPKKQPWVTPTSGARSAWSAAPMARVTTVTSTCFD